jgi:hypothetical protein
LSNPKVCHYWQTEGCTNEKCPFRHSYNPMTQIVTTPPSQTPCFYFSLGTCTKGDNCPFLHQIPKNETTTIPKIEKETKPEIKEKTAFERIMRMSLPFKSEEGAHRNLKEEKSLDSSMTNKEQEEKSEQMETLNSSEEIKRVTQETDVEMKETEKVEFRTLKRTFAQESPKLTQESPKVTQEIEIPKPNTNLLANISKKRSPSEMTPTASSPEDSLEVAQKKPKLKLKREKVDETKSEDESEKEQTKLEGKKDSTLQPAVVVALAVPPTPTPSPVHIQQPKPIEKKVPITPSPSVQVVESKPNVTLKTNHETKKPTSTYAISQESIELRKNLDEFEQFLISIEKNL